MERCKETWKKNEVMEIKKSQLVEMARKPSESQKDLCACVSLSVRTGLHVSLFDMNKGDGKKMESRGQNYF